MPTMRFYEHDGAVLCRGCRDELLSGAAEIYNQSLGGGRGDLGPRVRPRDLDALGERPWAGAPEGDRYVQCDHCTCQWGPDA